jgi:phospholipid/cholesterol/gamma-HCH transport system substrate-binding protein
MKNQRATEIKVGITVLFGLIVFIWILGWTKNFTFTSSDTQIKVMFDNVSGLEIGNDVTVNGVKKGHVRDFLVHESSVMVTLYVNSDIQLKKDATFFLESTDLMGGRKIEIKPGNLKEHLDFTALHRGFYRTDIAGIISIFSDLQDRIDIIVNETTEVLQGINSFLKDESFRQDIKNSLTNLNRVSVKLEEVLSENQQNMKEITKNTKEITADTKIIIKENKNNFESSIKNLNAVMLKSDSLLTTLNNLTQETITGGNNLGKILYDDSLYNNLIESIQSIKELTKVMLYQLEADGIKVDANIF